MLKWDPPTINNFEVMFEPGALTRGRQYHLEGRVGEINEMAGRIYAMVTGSRSRPYGALVERGPNWSIKSFACSCPSVISPCKHLAALLYALRENTAPCEDNPITKNTETGVLRIPEQKRAPFSLETIVQNPQFVPPKAEGRWRLVWFLARSADAWFFRQENDWTLRPARQFIKKNGEPGRITTQGSIELITEPMRDADKQVLETWRVHFMDRRQPVFPFGSVFERLQVENDCLVAADGRDTELAKIQRLASIRLDFVLCGISQTNQPEFFAKYTLTTEDGEKIIVGIDAIDALPETSQTVLILDSGATIVFRTKSLELEQLIIRIKTAGQVVGDTFASQCVAWCRATFSHELVAYLPEGELCIIQEAPTPVLVIFEERLSDTIYLECYFEYGSHRQRYQRDRTPRFFTDPAETETGEICIRQSNPEIEYQFVRYLSNLVTSSPQGLGKGLIPETIESFLEKHGERLLSEGVVLEINGQRITIQRSAKPLRVTAKTCLGWFDISLSLEEGEAAQPLKGIKEYGKNLFRANDSLMVLKPGDADVLRALLAQGLEPESGQLRIGLQDPGSVEAINGLIKTSDSGWQRMAELASRLVSCQGIASQPLPEGFYCTLRPYQQEGYDWLYFLNQSGFGGCLADDMGLGKTIQAIALLARLVQDGREGPFLVVAPVTTLPNWKSEFARFAPGIKIHYHHGQQRKQAAGFLEGSQLILTSYHTLQQDEKIFSDTEFDTIIIDEAQAIKNSNSRSFKVVRALRAQHRVSLTGTPVENDIMELWSQFEFLNPGLLGSVREFKKLYGGTCSIHGEARDASGLARLRRIVRPFILRRTKSAVAKELPSREEFIAWAEMGESQRRLYNRICLAAREKIAQSIDTLGVGRSAMHVFEAMLRLRQAAIDPRLLGEEYARTASAKFDLFASRLEDALAEGHKILVFSQFVTVLEYIKIYLESLSVRYAMLHGKTVKRHDVIKEFQQDPEIRVFLLSLKAGGVGINLTAADYVILFDPWWNPAVEAQAVDRSHRIGQDKPVIVYRMVVKDSIEEKILILQQRKKALADGLIGEDAGLFRTLTREDILGLFEEIPAEGEYESSHQPI